MKKWVKPGFLAKSVAYERQKEQTINENKQRLVALRLKHYSTSFYGSAQSKSTSKKGKKIVDTHSDDDYTPSDDEDESDDESLVHEVLYWCMLYSLFVDTF